MMINDDNYSDDDGEYNDFDVIMIMMMIVSFMI